MAEPANIPSLKEEWIIDIKSELEKTSPITSNWSICKVPVKLRSVNQDAYTPHIISIGPIHHKDEKLLCMEDRKRWYLVELFKRAEKPNENILGVFYDIVLDIDEQVRACYAEPIVYDKQEFAKILLHDAGFILELFLRYHESGNQDIDDPIFTTSWMITALQRDLALLENQIPFFVLESLFKLVSKEKSLFKLLDDAGIRTLNQLALQFFKCMLNMSQDVLNKKGSQESSHLLHLLYNCYLPIPKPEDSRSHRAYEVTDEVGVSGSAPFPRARVRCSAPFPRAVGSAPFPRPADEVVFFGSAPFPRAHSAVG